MANRMGARRLMVAGLATILAASAIILAGSAVGQTPNGQYFFTGVSEDQANKQTCNANTDCQPTATFSQDPPSGSDIVQTSVSNCGIETTANRFCAFWVGPYTGDLEGDLELCWYWSTTNAAAVAEGLDIEVAIFADPDYMAASTDRAQPERIIGRVEANLEVGPDPTQNVTIVPVSGTVEAEMLIQVKPVLPETGSGNAVHYGSADTPSAFGPLDQACNAPGGPAPEPTGEPSPEPTGEPSPSPSPTGGPEPTPDLDGPGVRLRFSSRTPERGGTFRAKALLLKCKGHAGTNIQIRRKKNGTFEKVATGKLDRNCKAVFKLRSNFSKATFRAVWPSQDKDHRTGRSVAKIIVTR